jgi:hypothetical protein
MSLPFKFPVNYRPTPVQITSESFSVSGGLALLAESPADPNNPATPVYISVTGSARTRVTGSPGVGEYRIKTQTVFNAANQARTVYMPVLEMNAADNNLTGAASYHAIGTMHTAEMWDALIWLLTPLTDIASLSALSSTYPASTSIVASGRPGRIAFLTDGAMYFSDGLTWRQVSGAGSGTTPDSWSDAMGLSVGAHVDSSASYSGVWSAAESIASAMHFDSFQSYVSAGVQGYITFNTAFEVASSALYSGSWDNANSFNSSFSISNSASYTAPAADLPIEFVAAGTTQNSDGATTVEVPSALVGDVVVLIGIQNVQSPVGVTQVTASAPIWYYIVSTSGAQSAISFTTDETEGGPWPCQAQTYVFRNVNQTTPIVHVSSAFNVSTTNHVTPSVTASSFGAMNVFVEGYLGLNRSYTAVTGAATSFHNKSQALGSVLMAYDSSSSGLTGTITATINTASTNAYTYLFYLQRA